MDTLKHSFALDGLRGLAAYLVVLSHYPASSWFTNRYFAQGSGQAGVMLFFVLSGFLIGRLYIARPLTRESLRSFTVKRISRVLPLYLLVVLASLALNVWLGERSFGLAVTPDNIWAHLLFWKGESVLWTIPVEIQFYALFPLLWWVFARFGNSFFALAAILATLMMNFDYPQVPALLKYLPFFLIGTLSAFIRLERNRLTDICFVFCLVFFFVTLPEPRRWLDLPVIGSWKSPLYMFLVPALLLTALYSRVALWVLGNRVLVFLGKISYSVYLLHIPVLVYIVKYSDLDRTTGWFFLAYIVGSTLAGAASFYCFETPVKDAINRTFAKRKAPEAPVVVI